MIGGADSAPAPNRVKDDASLDVSHSQGSELGARPRALLVAFHPLQNLLVGEEGASSGRGRERPRRS